MDRVSRLQALLRAKGIVAHSLREADAIDDRVRLESPTELQSELFLGSQVEVGAYSAAYGGRLRHIRVGRYCSIAPGFQCGWDNHPTDRITTSMISYVPDIHGWASRRGLDVEGFRQVMTPVETIKGLTMIGHDVWIGYGVFIQTGVTIGHGAVVASGSIVTRDVAPYAVVAGVPATVKKIRFDDQTIARCLTSRWWAYDIYDVSPAVMTDPHAFLNALDARIANGTIGAMSPEVVTGGDLKRL